MKKTIILTLSILCSAYTTAQKEMYNWVFGQQCGLTWNTTRSWPVGDLLAGGETELSGLPTPFFTLINGGGGTGTISDKKGNLLLYADAGYLYRGNHQQVPSVGFGGDHNTTGGGTTMAPFPGNSALTVVISGNQRYSMTLGPDFFYTIINSTTGAVIKEVTRMPNPAGLPQSVYVVRHANGADYWIVATGIELYNGTHIYMNAWLLTKDGISNTPVVSDMGVPPGGFSTSQYLKMTPEGDHFVWTYGGSSSPGFYYGDFNISTGTMSNLKHMPMTHKFAGTTGVEYSPDGSLVYVSTNPYRLHVYKTGELFSSMAPAAVTRKEYSLPVYNYDDANINALLLGPDKRIYGTRPGMSDMFILDNVNDFDNLKVYRTKADITVGGYRNQSFLMDPIKKNMAHGYGLPIFPASFFLVEPEIKAFGCTGNDVKYTVDIDMTGSGADQPVKITWDFGDGSPTVDQPLSVGVNSYSQQHTYATVGTRNIIVTPYRANGTSLKAIKMPAKTVDCSIRTNRMIRTDLQNTDIIKMMTE